MSRKPPRPDPPDETELLATGFTVDTDGILRMEDLGLALSDGGEDEDGDGDGSEFSGPVGAAYEFFEDLGRDITGLLGIRLVAGDRPGSSYYAARLTLTVDDANAAARAHDIAVRFRMDR